MRVVYWNGGGWVELDRRLDDQSGWNNARTMLWFRTQAALGALATDDNYYIYLRQRRRRRAAHELGERLLVLRRL